MSFLLFTVPLVIFLVFVAPLWLFFHYRSQKQAAKGLTDDEVAQLSALADKADRLNQRVEALESILDAEVPEWRTHHGTA